MMAPNGPPLTKPWGELSRIHDAFAACVNGLAGSSNSSLHFEMRIIWYYIRELVSNLDVDTFTGPETRR